MASTRFEEAVRREVIARTGRIEPPTMTTTTRSSPPRETSFAVSHEVAHEIYSDSRIQLVVDRVECWPEGFTIRLRLLGHTWQSESEDRLFTSRAGKALGQMRSTLELGVLYSDGRWSCEIDKVEREMFHGVTMTSLESATSHRELSQQVYLSPIPPAGPVVLIAEWPGRHIPLATGVLDGEEIRRLCLTSARASPGS